MKTHSYYLSFQDKNKNELTKKIVQDTSIVNVRKYRDQILATTQINDLFKIKISKIY